MATDLGIRVSQQARPLARVSMENPAYDTNTWVYSTAYKYDVLGHIPAGGARMDPRDTAIIHKDYPSCSSVSTYPGPRAYLATELPEYSYRTLECGLRNLPGNRSRADCYALDP